MPVGIAEREWRSDDTILRPLIRDDHSMRTEPAVSITRSVPRGTDENAPHAHSPCGLSLLHPTLDIERAVQHFEGEYATLRT